VVLTATRTLLVDPQVLGWARLAHEVLPLGPSERWIDEAACGPRATRRHAGIAGVSADAFHPSKGGSFHAARRICATCPVLVDCGAYVDRLEEGLAATEMDGFWAGETPGERLARRS
jgi:hypothetical protein